MLYNENYNQRRLIKEVGKRFVKYENGIRQRLILIKCRIVLAKKKAMIL